MWEGDRITGVIDWAETSWGPADLDVMHSRTNFALLHEVESAVAFSTAYDGTAACSMMIKTQSSSGP